METLLFYLLASSENSSMTCSKDLKPFWVRKNDCLLCMWKDGSCCENRCLRNMMVSVMFEITRAMGAKMVKLSNVNVLF